MRRPCPRHPQPGAGCSPPLDELDAGPTVERDRADVDVGRNLKRKRRGVGETLRGELLAVCRHDRCRRPDIAPTAGVVLFQTETMRSREW